MMVLSGQLLVKKSSKLLVVTHFQTVTEFLSFFSPQNEVSLCIFPLNHCEHFDKYHLINTKKLSMHIKLLKTEKNLIYSLLISPKYVNKQLYTAIRSRLWVILNSVKTYAFQGINCLKNM